MAHIVTVKTDGTHANTELFIDDKKIDFKSMQIAGDDTTDLDVVICLSQSRITQEQVKREIDGQPPAGGSHAIGFVAPYDEDFEDDEED